LRVLNMMGLSVDWALSNIQTRALGGGLAAYGAGSIDTTIG
jgi:hypothetical protein